MNEIKVSIIIPVYHAEKTLSKCLDSIKNQTESHWEVLMVDDGSTDDSISICRNYVKNDSRFQLFQQKNQGAGAARNKGLEHALGTYICFVDSDDYLSEQFLEETVKKAEEGFDLVISGYRDFTYKNGEEYEEKQSIPTWTALNEGEVMSHYMELFSRSFITAPWAKLYRHDIIKANSVKFENLRRCQDISFNIDYYSHVNSIGFVPMIGYHYYVSHGMLKKLPADYIEVWEYLMNKVKKMMQVANVHPQHLDDFVNKMILQTAYLCLKANYLGIWSKDRKAQRDYTNNLLKRHSVNQALCFDFKGKKEALLQLVLKSRVENIIHMFFKLLFFVK